MSLSFIKALSPLIYLMTGGICLLLIFLSWKSYNDKKKSLAKQTNVPAVVLEDSKKAVHSALITAVITTCICLVVLAVIIRNLKKDRTETSDDN